MIDVRGIDKFRRFYTRDLFEHDAAPFDEGVLSSAAECEDGRTCLWFLPTSRT